jgi:hypothetical protein
MKKRIAEAIVLSAIPFWGFAGVMLFICDQIYRLSNAVDSSWKRK